MKGGRELDRKRAAKSHEPVWPSGKKEEEEEEG